MSQSQPGNQAARKGKDWLDALRKTLHGTGNHSRLRNIAEKVVAAAEAGEPWAIQEIGNRLDGRPAQALEVSGPDGSALAIKDATAEEIDSRIIALTKQLGAWNAS